MKYKLLALVAMSCLSSAVMAEGIKGYIGLGGGSSFSSVKDNTTGKTNAYSAATVDLFGGIKFNDNIAMEVEYLSAGSFNFTGANMDTSGYGLSAVLSKPVGNWSFFGKIGLTTLTSKLTATPGYVLTVPASETKTGVSFGGGAAYSFTPNVALRLSLNSHEYSAGAGALSGRMGTFLVSGLFTF